MSQAPGFIAGRPLQQAASNSRSARSGRAWPLPLYGEHPDHAALRHVRLCPANIIESALHPLSIHAPAGLHRDVLHAVDGEGARDAGDAGVRAPLPQGLAGSPVKGTEVPVVGSAGEDEAAESGRRANRRDSRETSVLAGETHQFLQVDVADPSSVGEHERPAAEPVGQPPHAPPGIRVESGVDEVNGPVLAARAVPLTGRSRRLEVEARRYDALRRAVEAALEPNASNAVVAEVEAAEQGSPSTGFQPNAALLEAALEEADVEMRDVDADPAPP